MVYRAFSVPWAFVTLSVYLSLLTYAAQSPEFHRQTAKEQFKLQACGEALPPGDAVDVQMEHLGEPILNLKTLRKLLPVWPTGVRQKAIVLANIYGAPVEDTSEITGTDTSNTTASEELALETGDYVTLVRNGPNSFSISSQASESALRFRRDLSVRDLAKRYGSRLRLVFFGSPPRIRCYALKVIRLDEHDNGRPGRAAFVYEAVEDHYVNVLSVVSSGGDDREHNRATMISAGQLVLVKPWWKMPEKSGGSSDPIAEILATSIMNSVGKKLAEQRNSGLNGSSLDSDKLRPFSPSESDLRHVEQLAPPTAWQKEDLDQETDLRHVEHLAPPIVWLKEDLDQGQNESRILTGSLFFGSPPQSTWKYESTDDVELSRLKLLPDAAPVFFLSWVLADEDMQEAHVGFVSKPGTKYIPALRRIDVDQSFLFYTKKRNVSVASQFWDSRYTYYFGNAAEMMAVVRGSTNFLRGRNDTLGAEASSDGSDLGSVVTSSLTEILREDSPVISTIKRVFGLGSLQVWNKKRLGFTTPTISGLCESILEVALSRADDLLHGATDTDELLHRGADASAETEL